MQLHLSRVCRPSLALGRASKRSKCCAVGHMTHGSFKLLKKKTWEVNNQISWMKFFVRSMRLTLDLILSTQRPESKVAHDFELQTLIDA